MKKRICQSCGMPMNSEDQMGRFKDGNITKIIANTVFQTANSLIK